MPSPKATANPTRDDWWRGAVLYHVHPRSFADSDHRDVDPMFGTLAAFNLGTEPRAHALAEAHRVGADAPALNGAALRGVDLHLPPLRA